MRPRTRFRLAWFAAIVVSSATCSSSQLLVKADFDSSAERSPVGWVYAFDDAQGRKNRCVYIWSDATWSLAEETEPGYYGDQIAQGRIDNSQDGKMRTALGFPKNGLDGWKRVYVAGAVEAVYKGRPVPLRPPG